MRTTVSISDELLRSAKQRARERGMTLGQVVEAGLRRELMPADDVEVPELPVFTRGTGPRPGLDLTSNRAMSEALDEGLEFEQLR
jgi:hypothetical protein